MGDFNRKGTSIKKIMSYDRYIRKKGVEMIECDNETYFNIYFRLNMSSGNLFTTFTSLISSIQIDVLK